MTHSHFIRPEPAESTEGHVYGCSACDGAILPTAEQLRTKRLPDYCTPCSEDIEALTFAHRLDAVFAKTEAGVPCPNCDGGGLRVGGVWCRCDLCDGDAWVTLDTLRETGSCEPEDEYCAGIYLGVLALRELPDRPSPAQVRAAIAQLEKMAAA